MFWTAAPTSFATKMESRVVPPRKDNANAVKRVMSSPEMPSAVDDGPGTSGQGDSGSRARPASDAQSRMRADPHPRMRSDVQLGMPSEAASPMPQPLHHRTPRGGGPAFSSKSVPRQHSGKSSVKSHFFLHHALYGAAVFIIASGIAYTWGRLFHTSYMSTWQAGLEAGPSSIGDQMRALESLAVTPARLGSWSGDVDGSRRSRLEAAFLVCKKNLGDCPDIVSSCKRADALGSPSPKECEGEKLQRCLNLVGSCHKVSSLLRKLWPQVSMYQKDDWKEKGRKGKKWLYKLPGSSSQGGAGVEVRMSLPRIPQHSHVGPEVAPQLVLPAAAGPLFGSRTVNVSCIQFNKLSKRQCHCPALFRAKRGSKCIWTGSQSQAPRAAVDGVLSTPPYLGDIIASRALMDPIVADVQSAPRGSNFADLLAQAGKTRAATSLSGAGNAVLFKLIRRLRARGFRGSGVFPVRDLFRDRVFGKCAVVGDSGLLLAFPSGKAIDSHEAVFRFGNAPTIGWQRHVGSKTFTRVVRPEQQELGRELKREALAVLAESKQDVRRFLAFRELNGTKKSDRVFLLTPGFVTFAQSLYRKDAPKAYRGPAPPSQGQAGADSGSNLVSGELTSETVVDGSLDVGMPASPCPKCGGTQPGPTKRVGSFAAANVGGGRLPAATGNSNVSPWAVEESGVQSGTRRRLLQGPKRGDAIPDAASPFDGTGGAEGPLAQGTDENSDVIPGSSQDGSSGEAVGAGGAVSDKKLDPGADSGAGAGASPHMEGAASAAESIQGLSNAVASLEEQLLGSGPLLPKRKKTMRRKKKKHTALLAAHLGLEDATSQLPWRKASHGLGESGGGVLGNVDAPIPTTPVAPERREDVVTEAWVALVLALSTCKKVTVFGWPATAPSVLGHGKDKMEFPTTYHSRCTDARTNRTRVGPTAEADRTMLQELTDAGLVSLGMPCSYECILASTGCSACVAKYMSFSLVTDALSQWRQIPVHEEQCVNATVAHMQLPPWMETGIPNELFSGR